MQNDPSYQNLIEMGISPVMAEASIKKTGSNDISTLLDWIGAHDGEEAALQQWLKSGEAAQQNQEKPLEGISHLVNAEINAELQSLGHSKNVSEKALLINGNNKDRALKWIQQHKYDTDFEEALQITGQQEESNLTKEEAEAKLQELIKKAREKREKEEAEAALEREKNRMKSGKEALDVKRQTEEQRMRQQVELDKIEKEKDAQYKKQLLVQMKKQRCQKLGIPYVEQQEEEIKKKEAPKLSKTESIYVQIQQVKIGNYGYPEKAKILYDTTVIYLNNIIKNPTEPKYRKINTENNAFQNRIVAAFGGVELLHAIGFVQQGTFLVLNNPDIAELTELVKVLQKYSSQYQ